jgi:hypothetical protein
MVLPKPFDRAAFEAEPAAYLALVEPGRVWQTAEAGPSVKVLDVVGPAYLETSPGDGVTLLVTGEPLAPVSFTSFDKGAFDNGLPAITVRADSAGAASAHFIAAEGTIAQVNILAASPLAAGQVKFVVQINVD